MDDNDDSIQYIEQETSNNTQNDSVKEYLNVRSANLDIQLGSSSLSINELASLLIWVRDQFNSNGKGETTYTG